MVKAWKRDLQYDDRNDLLYIRLDSQEQAVINRRLSEDIVLDMGEDNKIVGIEILDASRHIKLDRLLPRKPTGTHKTHVKKVQGVRTPNAASWTVQHHPRVRKVRNAETGAVSTTTSSAKARRH